MEVENCHKPCHQVTGEMANAALSSFSPTCSADKQWKRKKKKPRYVILQARKQYVSTKCAAESVLFIVDKVGSLTHSHSKPPDVVSCYVRLTSPCGRSAQSRSLGQAEGQRAERVLIMTVEQKGAGDSRLENMFAG